MYVGKLIDTVPVSRYWVLYPYSKIEDASILYLAHAHFHALGQSARLTAVAGTL